jgi:hypothetical protein
MVHATKASRNSLQLMAYGYVGITQKLDLMPGGYRLH